MSGGFTGSDKYKVDTKGRVSIPAKHRRVFEECDPKWSEGKRPRLRLVHSNRQRNCLELYTMQAVDEVTARIAKLPRGSDLRWAFEQKMNVNAEDLEIDEEGRLVLARKYRDQIGLTDAAQFVAGTDTLEIWQPDEVAAVEAERWAAIEATLEPGVDLMTLLPEA